MVTSASAKTGESVDASIPATIGSASASFPSWMSALACGQRTV